MKNLILFFCLLVVQSSFAQTQNDDIIRPIVQLFDAMRAGDSSQVRTAFTTNPILETITKTKEGVPTIKRGSVTDFANAVGTPHDNIWDEKIWSYDIKQDGRMATVWTPYTFYVGEKMSHCGVNAFTLFETPKGWKINHIIDTRRRDNCQQTPDSTLNQLMNDWHHAATTTNPDVFFNTMGPQAIYLGTDATERWTKKEFETFAKPYFDKGKAWDFKTIERKFYYSQDGKVAWFNETLDTWMGVCRGSGVIEYTANGWKLQHYHLAIAVPNDKVKGYLELLKKR